MADAAVGIPVAVVAALAYGLGSVLQQRGASCVPGAGRVELRLLGRLIRHRVWLVGISSDGIGFSLRAVALGISPLALVAPLIASALPFALLFRALLLRRTPARGELVGSFLVSAGITAFLLSARPEAGRAAATGGGWVWAITLAATVAAVSLAFSRRASRRGPLHRAGGAAQAAWLAVGAVALFGVTAALTKTVVEDLSRSGVGGLTHWPIWALLMVGATGQVFNQAAYQLAELTASFPIITAGDPIVAAAIGVALFGENLSLAGWRSAGVALAVGSLVAGAAVMAVSAHPATAFGAGEAPLLPATCVG